MSVTVIGLWESGWMEAERTERRIYKQTIQAFAVDRWSMAPVRGDFSSPLQYDSMAEALAATPGRKTFLIPPRSLAGVSLLEYPHPEDAIYVFGNSHESLANYVGSGDDVVGIPTPRRAALFGHVALGIVLWDRQLKETR